MVLGHNKLFKFFFLPKLDDDDDDGGGDDDDLATNYGDGGKSFPERREGVVVCAAIVTKHGAGPLDLVHQPFSDYGTHTGWHNDM